MDIQVPTIRWLDERQRQAERSTRGANDPRKVICLYHALDGRTGMRWLLLLLLNGEEHTREDEREKLSFRANMNEGSFHQDLERFKSVAKIVYIEVEDRFAPIVCKLRTISLSSAHEMRSPRMRGNVG